MSSNPPVLIAGAGPTGLVLALILLKSGVSVRIIDKELTHRVGSKGSGIQPRTLELYVQLGIYDKLCDLGAVIPPIAVYKPGQRQPFKEGRLAEIVEPTPGTPYPNALNVPQDKHEAVLRTELAAHGVSVELGTELRDFEQSEEYVLATLVKHSADGAQTTETAPFDWLVGADGAHSVVRKKLGLSFLADVKAEQDMAIGDIEVDGVERGLWHMWSSPGKTMLLRSSHPNSNMFMFAYTSDMKDSQSELPASGLTREQFIDVFYGMTQLTPSEIQFGKDTWMSRYRPNIRMVDSMRKGRVFLAGDAAHCHSPAGGQGLNSSVQDAGNLAWKLALVQKRMAPASLLDTYSEERIRVIAHMLSLTTELYQKTMDTFKLQQQDKDDDAFVLGQRGRETSMLGINYRGSSIISDSNIAGAGRGAGPAAAYDIEAHTHAVARPAYRAPDAPGLKLEGSTGTQTRSLFDVFDVTKHTVLVFASPGSGSKDLDAILGFVSSLPEGAAQAVRVLPAGFPETENSGKFELTLVDALGHAYKEYGASNTAVSVVVIRPDGVVGAMERDVDGLKGYFRKVLSISA
ncbi:FAD-binding-3 domain-containing protein [Mycena chlorophos]|uniref:FAD-binding-3 domain-containing protein n=1 Tax=Mycena chlorophos TaxID=658473 RepID=A0A8H6TIZ8_MYCCL|nr:FAD-binding-3 domain-containing protein [Mycena chlorophos]